MNGLDDKTFKDFNDFMIGKVVPGLILIADKYNYDRDDFIKYAATIIATMSETATFKNYKLSPVKPQEPINKCVQKAYEDGKKDGYVQAKVEQENRNQMNNSEWIDFLTGQFNISRTSAKEMLHVMMRVKQEDNFKKQFSGRKG